MLRENRGLFYSLSSTDEDAKKGEMYKVHAKREASRQEFADIKSYLASLGMKMTVYEDDSSIIPRMAQLSQKTNQFNLTTRRYTENAVMDSFLMSCRVIGRDVEFGFMDCLMGYLKDHKIDRVSAQYIKTPKNTQVMDFFDRCSFVLNDSTETGKNYSLNITDYKFKQIDYMEIIDGKSNQKCHGGRFSSIAR